MQKIIQDSFKILKNNMLFIQPLFLYLLFMMLALSFFFNKSAFFLPKIILAVSLFFLTIAFTAGWFYINKFGVISFNQNDSQEEAVLKNIQNLKKFFEGVWIEFPKTLALFCVIFILCSIIGFLTYKFCMHFFGEPKIIYELSKISDVQSQAELLNFINNIPENDKITFFNWMYTLLLVSFFTNYFSLLYFAVSFFEKVNVFKSLFLSIKFFVANIFSSLIIILTIFLISAIINILYAFFGTNTLSFVILLILYTLYFNYSVILVFYFYYEKTKTNSNNRTIGIR